MARRKTTSSTSSADFEYAAARRTYESLRETLMAEFAGEPALLREAWGEFTGAGGMPDPDDPDGDIFLDWLMWHFLFEVEDGIGANMPTMLVADNPAAFNSAQHDFIERSAVAALSFFRVLATVVGKTVRVQDLLVGDEFVVTERVASGSLEPGDIVFGSVLVLAGVSMFLALAPSRIPPMHGLPIIDIKKQLRKEYGTVSREHLQKHALELLQAYREILAPLRAPLAEQVANTDGDPLEFRRLQFDLEMSPEDAIHKLAALTDLESPAEIIERGQADGEYDLDWTVRGGRRGKKTARENTLLGQILISPGRLIASVNSARRETEIRKLIEKHLKKSVRYRATSIESMTAAMRATEGRAADTSRGLDPNEDPEIQAALQDHVRRYYEGWLDETIPALGNRTPREAARDADLREVLEGLLVEFERMGTGDELMAPPVDWLRSELGMPQGAT